MFSQPMLNLSRTRKVALKECMARRTENGWYFGNPCKKIVDTITEYREQDGFMFGQLCIVDKQGTRYIKNKLTLCIADKNVSIHVTFVQWFGFDHHCSLYRVQEDLEYVIWSPLQSVSRMF